MNLNLLLHRIDLVIYKLDIASAIPFDILNEELFYLSKTGSEISLVCVAQSSLSEISSDTGWRLFKIINTFDFSVSGVLYSVIKPLSEGGVGIFAFSTFDADCVMVKNDEIKKAIDLLESYGHIVNYE